MGIKFYYGLKDRAHAEIIVNDVCANLDPHYMPESSALILETASAESQLGQYKDPTPNGAGRGWLQCDKIALIDIQMHLKKHHAKIICDAFGYDVSIVKHEQLDNDPLLAAIICRLHYKRVPDKIPLTMQGRAEYWKKHYNKTGKGTQGHYIKSTIRCLGGC